MKKKDKRELKRGFGLAVLGALLGFFVSLTASGVFEGLIHGWSVKVIFVVVGFGFVSVFFVSLFSHLIDNIDRVGNMSEKEFFKDYLQSIFHLKK
jgi:hypothetical protein